MSCWGRGRLTSTHLSYMTAFTALLAIKEVSQQTLCVYVSLLQSAGPTGAIEEKPSVIRRHHNKLFSTRIDEDTVKEEIDTLVEKGIIPSRGATYPFASSGGSSPNIDKMIEKLESDMSEVRPDTENFPDDTRIFAALKMANALEIATTEKKIRVTVDDEAVVADGEQKKRVNKEWDYGLVGKLKSKYGTEDIIDTICEIHLHGGFDQFEGHSFQKRREQYRKYLIGALEGDTDPSKESEEVAMIY